MNMRYFIGLSSGSSLEGVDAALVRSENVGQSLKLQFVQFDHQPYPREVREALLPCSSAASLPPKQVNTLHRILGEAFAAVARRVADQAKVDLQQIACLGLSG